MHSFTRVMRGGMMLKSGFVHQDEGGEQLFQVVSGKAVEALFE